MQAEGYECRDNFSVPVVAQGLRAWPAVLTVPTGPAPLEHWPNIISILFDNKERLISALETTSFTEEVI